MPSPRFEKGNPGRQTGTPNKTTKLVKEVFAEVFTKLQSDKSANLWAWGKENPTEFYKLASKLIPAQVSIAGDFNHNVMALDPLNDTTANDSLTEDSQS